MKAVIQRVQYAEVKVNGNIAGKCSQGFMILVGIEEGDKEGLLKLFSDKIANIRIFGDESGKMNLSIKEIKGEILLISQFTLAADCKKGRRPGFSKAAKPESAEKFYIELGEMLRNEGIKVEMGVFGADMKVTLLNDGPVTIILDSRDL